MRREGIVSIYYLSHNLKDSFDPNAADLSGASPLHYAVMKLQENNMRALISLGADVNMQDKRGDSPLHIALQFYD